MLLRMTEIETVIFWRYIRCGQNALLAFSLLFFYTVYQSIRPQLLSIKKLQHNRLSTPANTSYHLDNRTVYKWSYFTHIQFTVNHRNNILGL